MVKISNNINVEHKKKNDMWSVFVTAEQAEMYMMGNEIKLLHVSA